MVDAFDTWRKNIEHSNLTSYSFLILKMSGFLHKAKDAMHLHHHDQNKAADHGRDNKTLNAPAGEFYYLGLYFEIWI